MQITYDYSFQTLQADNSATKFGYAFYLSYFFRNIVMLDKRFELLTLKKIAKPYTVVDFCMEISLAISVGCYPLSKIDSEFLEERKLACSIGLKIG
ncbi:hypothetical protein BGP_2098 [Beggiatoa sp. PS]|nr:hypothetical protein BGP_2098 [Beggiatoa sp. PS]